MYRPFAILLVGLPGSGKSTYRNKLTSSIVCSVASSDDYLDFIAERNGMTYNEVFQSFVKEADQHFRAQIALASERRENVIIDRTNLSKKTRANIINALKKTHDITAVVFEISDEDLTINLDSRPGKTIPLDIVNRMKYTYTVPELSEGFGHIEVVKFTRD